MIYPQDALDEVLARSEIVDIISSYTALKQRGSSFVGLCPFHREKTPSFSVSADKQLFHCFGCGESGNVYGFIMKAENLGFMEAVKFLADRAHYTLPEKSASPGDLKKRELKETLFEINKLAARFFYDCLASEDGREAASYLDKRKVAQNIRMRFGLGCSPDKWDSLYKFLVSKGYSQDVLKHTGLVLFEKGIRDKFKNRLMFPILDAMGGITGFGGRILGEGNVKYLNSPETPIFSKSRNLYGLNFARKSRTKEFILVEGYMDVLALHQAGFTNAVASLGTAFNQEHARLMKKYVQKAVLIFDSDSAGINAALRAIPELEGNGIACRVLTLKGAKDPDEFITTYGKEAFAKAVTEASGSVTFRINTIKGKYNLQKTEEKVDFTNEVSKLLASLPNAIERSAYIKEVSGMSGISEEAVVTEVNKLTDKYAAVVIPERGVLTNDKNVSKGAVEARRSLINLAASSRTVSEAVKNVLNPEQLLNDNYSKLLQVIFDKNAKGQNIYPAELVNFFETYEEQKEIANIFSTAMPEAGDKAELELILTQLVREIMKSYIEHTARAETDAHKLDKIRKIKENLSNLNIKVADC